MSPHLWTKKNSLLSYRFRHNNHDIVDHSASLHSPPIPKEASQVPVHTHAEVLWGVLWRRPQHGGLPGRGTTTVQRLLCTEQLRRRQLRLCRSRRGRSRSRGGGWLLWVPGAGAGAAGARLQVCVDDVVVARVASTAHHRPAVHTAAGRETGQRL